MALTQIGTDGIKDDAVTLAKKAGIERGKLIIGDASGNPAALAKGSNGQVLTTDGTDISWGSGADASKMPLAGGTFTGDVTFDNSTHSGFDITWDESDKALEFADSTKAVFGSDGDLEIYHNDTNTVIDGKKGSTYVKASGTNGIAYVDGKVGTSFHIDGSERLLISDAVGAKFADTINVSKTSGGGGIRLTEEAGNGSAYVGFKCPDDKGSDNSYELTLPSAVPTAGKVLKANASTPTTLEWGDAGGNTTTGTQNFTVADGNLVIGTEGHGIDFSASSAGNNSASVTSELLQDYEEGTFNITIASHQGDPQFTYTNQVGKYCKVGRNVTVHGSVAWNDEDGIWGYPRIEGLPCLGSINGSQQVHLSFSNIDGYTAGSDQGSEGQWTWATLWIGPNSGNGTMWRNKWGGQYPLQISGGCQKNQGSMSFTGTYIAYQAN